jgi:transcriptional regulator with XRE-family HTH domain
MSGTEEQPMAIDIKNWKKLSNRQYRHALAASQFKRFVPFQIGALRKQRKWSQQELAERSEVTQGVISKAEDPDNGNLTVNTILRIANGFDVVFVGKFVPYSEFNQWRTNLSEKTVILDFDKENEQIERLIASSSLLRVGQEGGNLSVKIEGQKSDQKVTYTPEWHEDAQGEKQMANEIYARAAAGGGK